MTAETKRAPLRVAFLGSANWDLVARDFTTRCAKLLGCPAEIARVPFGQYRSQLWDAGSTLRRESWDVWIFCERLEDFVEDPLTLGTPAAQQAVRDKITLYLESIKAARSLVGGVFLVLDLAPVRPLFTPLQDAAYAAEGVRRFVHDENARLLAAGASLPDCDVVPLTTLLEAAGTRQADPGKYWQLGRMPFSPAFGGSINECILSLLLARRGQTVRLLVTDLDNTLWSGIIGEDGVKNIKLGPDFPGNVHVEIQRCLRALKDQGIALAICSRNTEAIALAAIAEHPDMVLRVEDFAARRINWGDKAENIRALAAEIGVGLAHVCFLDDSPHERERVRTALPEVRVPELPADASEWPAWLARYPFLTRLRLTEEDRGRAERYRQRARLQQEAASFASREDYWRSLGMRLHFHRLDERNLQRTLQLLAKTNQFNLTNRRHGELDLQRLQAAGARIVPIGLADKFSPPEIVGVAIIQLPADRAQPATIESLVLSCRVLGRSVETAVLGWLCSVAQRAGHRELRGLLVRTERNVPAQSFYPDHGFTATDAGGFLLALDRQPVAVPDYFEIQED